MAHKHSVLDNPGQIAGIAALAAGVGALTAMVIAPKSGKETRGRIRDQFSNMKQKMGHVNEGMSETLDSASTRVGGTARRTKSRMSETTDKVRKDSKLTAKEMKEAAKGGLSDAHDEVDHIRKHGER